MKTEEMTDASPIFLKIPFVNDRLNKKNQKHPQRL